MRDAAKDLKRTDYWTSNALRGDLIVEVLFDPAAQEMLVGVGLGAAKIRLGDEEIEAIVGRVRHSLKKARSALKQQNQDGVLA